MNNGLVNFLGTSVDAVFIFYLLHFRYIFNIHEYNRNHKLSWGELTKFYRGPTQMTTCGSQLAYDIKNLAASLLTNPAN